MPCSNQEREAVVRVSDALDTQRKPNPADIRIIFAGRYRDKLRYCNCSPAQAIAWVTQDMQRLFGFSPSTIRWACSQLIREATL